MNKVCVVGLGYIGLPTALMLAANGVGIVGTDINQALLESLNKRQLTFEEAGMPELLDKAVDKGIVFQDTCEAADMYIVAVPTPYDSFNKKIDAHYVVAAVRQVASICPDGAIVVIESTISPGTIDRDVRPVLEEIRKSAKKQIHVVHAPERIIPGNMLYELENNARIIGADDSEVGKRVKEVYTSFCRGEIVITDIRTAEMTKVVENTFRDVNIAFANELCKICRQDDMDVYEIIRIANMHPRVNILQPGPGVGGHCISVDPWFLVGDYPGLSLLIHEARKINDSMPEFVLSRVTHIMEEKGMADVSRVGFYGLTYKEDVDDTRESPTLQLLEKVREHLGAPPKTFDPFIREDLVPNQYHDFSAFLKDIDLVVIMTAHSHIRENIGALADKVVLDTRNICSGDNIYKL